MRRVPIRLKLVAALAIPLLALGTVTVLEVAQSSRRARETRTQTELATATVGPSSVLSALQGERTWAAVDLIGEGSAFDLRVEGYPATRAATDKAIGEFRTALARRSPAVRKAFAPAMAGLDRLDAIRGDIDGYAGSKSGLSIGFDQGVFRRYTDVITPFFEASTRISVTVDDADLRQGTQLADTVARQVETISVMLSRTASLSYLTPGGIDQPAEVKDVTTLQETFRHYAAVLTMGTGPYADLQARWFPTELTRRIDALESNALTQRRVSLPDVVAAAEVPYDQSYLVYQDEIGAQIAHRAGELNAAATARTRWFKALTLFVLAAAAALTVLVSRSITRPLRSLTQQAKEMAEERLPDAVLDILDTPLGDDVAVPRVAPVQVHTRDEVADVADALNIVQDTALDLAVEQAVLRRNIADSFVNLGRRNQNLLGRQLDFITELETNETDPDTLANLFRLDHLATRMRRNAESLLVLAGIEPPRKWAAPVRLTDVIRAALGEVEDYQRVTVRGVEPATILGSAAADLAHLLAELVENALVFSPPDQTVDIRGRHQPDRYTLAIIDSGLGMPTTDITAANRRLAGTESFTIAPSKYLGHYVAGNLAARHDITVHLDNSPGTGITATIDVPPTLLTTDEAEPQPEEHHAGRTVWPPSPSEQVTSPALPPSFAGGPPFRTGEAPVLRPAPGGGASGRSIAYPRARFGAVPGAGAPAMPPSAPTPQPVSPAQPAPAAFFESTSAAFFEPAPAAYVEPELPAWYTATAPGAPAAAAPFAGPGPVAEPAADPAAGRRTPSGLVKRTPRVVDIHESPPLERRPSADLLASLSAFTDAHDLSGPFGPDGSPAGGRPPAVPEAPAGPAARAGNGEGLPRRNREAPTPAPSPTGTGTSGLADPPTSTTPDWPPSPTGTSTSGLADPAAGVPAGSPPAGAGPDLAGLATGQGPAPAGWSPPPAPAPRASAPQAGGTGFAGGPGLGGLAGGLGNSAFARPRPGPAARSDGTITAAGLARRVRGAQMPTTAPVTVRRSDGAAAPPRTVQDRQSADAVYSFLTNFTAGVERGLDDTRNGDTGGPG